MKNIDEISLSIKVGSIIKILDSVTRKTYSFEQIAAITYNDDAYCILRPVEKIKGLGYYDGVVYRVDEDYNLEVETDDYIVLKVFEKYLYSLKPKK